MWQYSIAQTATNNAVKEKENAEQALSNFKKEEAKRLEAEREKEEANFTQLLDNIENSVIPAKGTCPDDEMMQKIATMKTKHSNDALLRRIQGLENKLIKKGCL